MEIWKKINGFNDYEVSNEGNVRSLDRSLEYIQTNQYNSTIATKILKGKDLTPRISKSGYLRVKLNNKDKYIHRLVAEMFIGNITKKLEINHKDGNKSNNKVSNLEIVTRIQNQNHAYDNNLNKIVEKAIKVNVNGTIYESLGEASKSENIPKGVLHKRLKNPDVKSTGNFKYSFTIKKCR